MDFKDPKNLEPTFYNPTKGADIITRLKMGFAKPEYKKAVLQEKYGAENVGIIDDKNDRNYGKLVVKDNEEILLVDEETFSFKDFADTLGQAPELFGQIIGGVGGFLAGGGLASLPTGVAGAASGGAGGDLVRQKMADKMNVPSPEGVEKGDLRDAAIRGAVGEVGGFALAKLAGRLLSPFKNSMTPETVALRQEADTLNVPWSSGDITKHRGMNIVDSTLDKMLGSAGQYQRLRTGQLQRTGEMADELIESVGGKIDPTNAGTKAGEAYETVYEGFKGRAKELYDAVEELSHNASSIDTPTLNKTIQLIKSKDVSKTLPSKVRKTLKDIESDLFKEEMVNGVKVRIAEPLTYSHLRLLRSAMGKNSKSLDVIAQNGQGYYKMLKSAIEKDLRAWADGPALIDESLPAWKNTEPWQKMRQQQSYKQTAIKEAMDMADEFYKMGDEVLPSIKDINSKVGRILSDSDNPEKVVQKIFKPKNLTNIIRTRKLVGEDGFKTLKQAFLTEFLEGAEGKWTGQGNIEVIFPKKGKIDKLFKDYSLKELKFILGEDALNKLTQLQRMTDLSRTAQTMAGNPSGTGQIMLAGQSIQDLFRVGQGGAATAGYMVGGPVGAAAPFVGPWGLAKLILSGPGKRYLTSGAKLPKSVEAVLNASGIAGGRGLMGYESMGRIK